jgi:hypothetical protein
MHLGNPKTGKIFIKNFFTDFKVVLGRKHVIKDFAKCDFEPIRRHLNEQKIIRKAITDDERKANKQDKNQALFKFGFAIVDGHLEKVGNYNMVSYAYCDYDYLRYYLSYHRFACLIRFSFFALPGRNLLERFEDVESTPKWER